MKVSEKGTDRRAEVNLYVDGRVPPLIEYGEYVDFRDKAISCFVEVEPGQKIKIGGRFAATTQSIHYDVLVDGILRKANSYSSKSVSVQKTKKLDMETFLFWGDNGIVDTEIIVTPISGNVILQENGLENIGTIEMRVSVLRRFGDEHALYDVETCYSVEGEGHSLKRPAGYKTIAPEFAMTYEKNCAALDNRKANAYRRKMIEKRPGTEPWAVFRFHFRSKQSILEKNLPMTFNASSKVKSTPRILDIEVLPTLPIGAKPGDDSSTRQSTPLVSSVPTTPAKGSKDEPFPTLNTPSQKQQTKATTPTPPEKTRKKTPATSERSPTPDLPDTSAQDDEDLRAPLFSNSSQRPLSTSPRPLPTRSIAQSIEMATHTTPHGTAADVDGTINGKKCAEMAEVKDKDVAPKVGDKDKSSGDEVKDNGTDTAKPANANPNDHADSDCFDEDTPTQNGTELTNGTKSTNDTAAKSPSPQAQESPQPTTPKSIARPAPATTTTIIESTAQKDPATPTKRLSDLAISGSPEAKRTKLSPSPNPAARFTSPASRLTSPASATKSEIRIARQLAEARKRLKEAQEKREAIAKEQEDVEKSLTPYQQQMQEELERLNKAVEEEERAKAEEEQRLRESIDALEEFQNADLKN